MTTDIQTAARALLEAAERARTSRMREIDEERIECRALILAHDKARERLALLDAEYARVEAQKIEDIARQALEPMQEQPKPEPYRAGLPPERLRKVWAEWEDQRGDIVRFSRVDVFEWMTLGGHPNREPTQFSTKEVSGAGMSFRPHGATWARVEAMADEAEKPTLLDLRTVCLAEDHADPDWVVADADLFDIDESSPSVEKGQRFQVERVAAQHHGAPRVKIHVSGNQVFIGALQPAHVEPRTPELLDLTKLPPGTVCEATGQIARGSHVILPGERFAFAGSPTELLARVRVFGRDESFDVPTVVYARVVKEPKGKGDSDG